MLELNAVLDVVTSIFTIILLIVFIIIGIKIIQLENKAEKILDDVDKKINSINGVFNIISKATTSIDLLSSKITNKVIELISNIFKRKKEDENNYE